RRVNDAGTFVYRDLAGGPHPEVTPDGLGGWEVTIELWPGRAEPVVLPSGGTPIIDRLAIDVGSFAVPDQYGYIFVPNADLLVTAVRIVTPGDVAGENEVVRLWRDSDQALLAT